MGNIIIAKLIVHNISYKQVSMVTIYKPVSIVTGSKPVSMVAFF